MSEGIWVRAEGRREKKRMMKAPDPNNMKWKENSDQFGHKMLEKMGWSCGKGLGKDESGSTNSLKIAKRHENSGIGLGRGESNHKSFDTAWSSATAQYESLLANLNANYGKANKSNNASSDSSDSDCKPRKKRKREKTDVEKSRKADKKNSKADMSKTKGVHNMYSKRVASKNSKHYSREQMDEILGKGVTVTENAGSHDANSGEEESYAEDDEVADDHIEVIQHVSLQDYFSKKIQNSTTTQDSDGGNGYQDNGFNCGLGFDNGSKDKPPTKFGFVAATTADEWPEEANGKHDAKNGLESSETDTREQRKKSKEKKKKKRKPQKGKKLEK